ncbi:MAG: hypothetical protein IJ172_07885 [Ruminococcus sp.]|nr:hypothetical protein [Ruminococcus sp.]
MQLSSRVRLFVFGCWYAQSCALHTALLQEEVRQEYSCSEAMSVSSGSMHFLIKSNDEVFLSDVVSTF